MSERLKTLLPEGFTATVERGGTGDPRGEWQAACAHVHGPVEVALRDPAEWEATLDVDCFGSLQVATELTRGPGVLRRSVRAPADRGAAVLLRLQLEGDCLLEQDGRSARLRVGGLAFVDSGQPYRLVLGEVQQARTHSVPRALLRLTEPQLRGLTARELECGQDTPAALFQDLLSGLVEQALVAPPDEREPLARSAADAVALLALLAVGTESPARGQLVPPLLKRIEEYVQTRLDDPDLTPQQIADRHGISVRYLHLLFRRSGTTVNSFVRTRRLEAARAELARPEAARRAVAAVAGQWGFTSSAHFSRVFRDAYGMSPVQWRAAARGAAAEPGALAARLPCTVGQAES